MLDAILSGLLGGVLGPAFAAKLSKFKYWMIFLVAMIATHVGLFLAGVFTRGFSEAIRITLRTTFTSVGIFVPALIGGLAVLVAFVGRQNEPKKEEE